MDAELLRTAGHWLHLIRAIEEAGRRLYLQGRLPGSFYDGRGQEATAVGSALAMEEDDVACPLIRDMAVHLVRGVTPSEFLRHYLGKSGGPMERRDGNIHLGAFDRGTIPMISHLPEMLPVGMGVALSRSWRGVPSAALGFSGDGASCGGVFHETLNLAAVWNAPLVVVVERNRCGQDALSGTRRPSRSWFVHLRLVASPAAPSIRKTRKRGSSAPRV